MWERFGYYLMIGIFTLYLKDTERGFGLNEAQASDLYGTFIALVFLTPLSEACLPTAFWVTASPSSLVAFSWGLVIS